MMGPSRPSLICPQLYIMILVVIMTENSLNKLSMWEMYCLLYLKSQGPDCFRYDKIQVYKCVGLSLWRALSSERPLVILGSHHPYS